MHGQDERRKKKKLKQEIHRKDIVFPHDWPPGQRETIAVMCSVTPESGFSRFI